MTEQELKRQYCQRYLDEIEAGSTIDINASLPYVGIDMSNGDEYFFQGEDAENLLNDCPGWINKEVYLLVMAQNW